MRFYHISDAGEYTPAQNFAAVLGMVKAYGGTWERA